MLTSTDKRLTSSTDKLQALYEAGIMFSITVYAGKAVQAHLLGKHFQLPHAFETFEAAVDYLWESAGLDK